MNRSAPLHASFILLLTLSCASSNAERSGEASRDAKKANNAEMQAAMAAAAEEARLAAQKLQQAQADAEAKCGALSGKPVPSAEEHVVGEAVAKAFIKPDAPAPNEKLAAYVQKVGEKVAAHARRSPGKWTFVVVEDPQPKMFSTLGGYVFIPTLYLSLLKDEAQLAAVLAHEVAHVSDDWLGRYDTARLKMCRTALTSMALTEAGVSSIPGGGPFVQNTKLSRSMKKLADPNGLNLDGDDAEFLSWYAGQFLLWHSLERFPDDVELKADAQAVELLHAAGYDTGALALALEVLPAPPGTVYGYRRAALDPLKVQKGKTPPFPKDVPFPK
jgi:predicted Zn-dependent protease